MGHGGLPGRAWGLLNLGASVQPQLWGTLCAFVFTPGFKVLLCKVRGVGSMSASTPTPVISKGCG